MNERERNGERNKGEDNASLNTLPSNIKIVQHMKIATAMPQSAIKLATYNGQQLLVG